MKVTGLWERSTVNDLDTQALRTMAAASDFAAVMKYSHRIKGASLMLGATSLAAHCGHRNGPDPARRRAIAQYTAATVRGKIIASTSIQETR